jgi:hypothetical protein
MAYGSVKVDTIIFDDNGSDQNVTVSGLYRATTSGVTVSGTIAAGTVSGVTVIGSTTVSGATVTGTTANFTSGNFSNLISAAATMSGALIMANQQQVQFREAVGNGVNHIALQAPAIVSADQTITLPDQTGTVITTGDNGSVSSTMLATNLTISAAAGSAAAPSIAFTDDLNTGIYSPGADQLAVSTGGTGRLFVDASGDVTISDKIIHAGDTDTAIVDSRLRILFRLRLMVVSASASRATGNCFWRQITPLPLSPSTKLARAMLWWLPRIARLRLQGTMINFYFKPETVPAPPHSPTTTSSPPTHPAPRSTNGALQTRKN